MGRGAGRRRTAATVVAALCASVLSLVAVAVDRDAQVGVVAERGSVDQVAVTHATPGDAIELRDEANAIVKHGTVDDLGSFLFRDLTSGDGYSVVEHDAAGDQTSPPIHVLSDGETPAQSFYANQHLDNGFGYITTRDGTKLSITVHLPGPANAGPYPTVVEYSGYDPSNPNAPQPSTQIMQLLGYATVGVNIRGTGCSGGAFWYFEPLQSLDGYDVIEAVAAQPASRPTR